MDPVTPMTVLSTADTHFGHAGALGLYRRPLASVAAIDAALIEYWNRAVAPTDEIYHPGDFAMASTRERIETLVSALHGRRHLIIGNNDQAGTRDARGWSTVQPYLVPAVLCHYALRTWRDIAKGALNLHGHSHGRLKPLPRQYDVGIDVWRYRPVSLEVLMAQAPAAREHACKAMECQPRGRHS